MHSQIIRDKLNIKKISAILSCHGCDLKWGVVAFATMTSLCLTPKKAKIFLFSQ